MQSSKTKYLGAIIDESMNFGRTTQNRKAEDKKRFRGDI